MKIIMIGRATLFTHPGGDTMQLVKTAEYLNKLDDIEVEVSSADQEIDFNSYDLLHLFNISRPSDHLGFIKRCPKPYVISTVFVDFSEAEKNHFQFKRRLLYQCLSANQLEYIKALGRIIKGQDKMTDFRYLLKGHRRSIRFILKKADMLLPNSKNEYHRLVKAYGIKQRYAVIPNAIDLNTFQINEGQVPNEYEKFNNAVISVGQITPVKNQLGLIKALSGSEFKVFIIGSPSSNALAYFERCRAVAGDNINFVSHLTQEELAFVYFKAKVHALASWFETTGLVSLEAAFLGCNIVISNRGDQKEYFRNDAYYCDPDHETTILDAVRAAFAAEFNQAFKARIKNEHSWEVTAQKTYFAYKQIID
ncbi:MAG: glycosyltransferase family 4 protein [Flavobacteriaceae bacterium]|nr:glycosyltransferase family 4 protein [Bacteroidia bacterium]MBT8286658.1 glycosyltransferase family 4 protein [Bacteroidia bacterium]NNF75183.1 glycosyltransferase family 4 protein [Flavobacteriaceae bacterium]NNK72444.1 glycosyltransferase family 4 protein [Flavobacteriaceae bacterium]